MADYDILFQKADTIATGSSLAPGATSFLLTSGNFGTHTDYYVVDYDVPGLAEVVELAVNGTQANVISRGRDGAAQSTHTAGAKIGSMWTTSHQQRLEAMIPTVVKNQGGHVSSPSDVLVAAGTGTTTNTSLTLNPTVASILQVSATFDFDSTAYEASFIGNLQVDGTTQTGAAIFVPSSSTGSDRKTIAQNWSVPLSAGTHTIQLYAQMVGGTGSAYLHSTHTGYNWLMFAS